jgi:hypothetical protein
MPVDQWTFLDADDTSEELDDGPEAAALHECPFEDSPAVRDPGRSDVDIGQPADDRVVLVRWFSDEDDGADDDGSDADDEPDLVEILITQHYAFADGDD